MGLNGACLRDGAWFGAPPMTVISYSSLCALSNSASRRAEASTGEQ